MKKIALAAIAVSLSLGLFSQTKSSLDQIISRKNDSITYFQTEIKRVESQLEDVKLEKLRNDLRKNGLPKVSSDQEIIEHSAMMLVYSEKHEQALWVAHIITPDVVKGNEGRSNDFRPDPKVKTGSSVELDYFIKTPKADGEGYYYDGFGYDRGHLAPSADFRWSPKALSESFYYSNMSPQAPEFNRDSWAKLEDLLRAYIYRNPTASLYVVTGGILKDDLPKVERGVNKVSIPNEYYKIAIDIENKRAIAFVMPNKLADKQYESYVKNIKEVEEMTGIDFFANLDDALENELESLKDIKPFLSEKEQQNVAPLDPLSLGRNTFNTDQAKMHMGSGKKVTVCGTAVSTKLSSKGNVFINLDKQFPNQVFSVSIFKDKMVNFSYKPEEYLLNQKVCFTGQISNYNGTPSMSLDNEKQVRIMEEEMY